MPDTCGMAGGRRRSRKMKGGDGSCGLAGGRRRTRKGGMTTPKSPEEQCVADGGVWRDGVCEPAAAPMGGRRRRRPMKGGMGYGFGGAMGTNGPVWNSSWGGEITKGGEPIYDTADRPAVGGGRRRKSKTAKKGGKRRRTMRGGAQWQSIADTGYGFTGTGARGLADAVGYASKVPPASGGYPQNPDGAYSP